MGMSSKNYKNNAEVNYLYYSKPFIWPILMPSENTSNKWRRLLQMNALEFSELKNWKIKYVLEKCERTKSEIIYEPPWCEVIGHKTFIRLPEEITKEQLLIDYKSIRKRKYQMTKKYFSTMH